MDQPKLFRAVWAVRAQFCRTLVSVCREKPGVVMPEILQTHGVDLIIKVIAIMEASLSWEEGDAVLGVLQSWSLHWSFPSWEILLGAALILWRDSKSIPAKGTEQRTCWRKKLSGDSCLMLPLQHDYNGFSGSDLEHEHPLKVWIVCRKLLGTLCKTVTEILSSFPKLRKA